MYEIGFEFSEPDIAVQTGSLMKVSLAKPSAEHRTLIRTLFALKR